MIEIKTQKKYKILTITISGSAIIDHAVELKKNFDTALNSGVRTIIINMKNTKSLDLTFIQLMIKLIETLKNKNINYKIDQNENMLSNALNDYGFYIPELIN